MKSKPRCHCGRPKYQRNGTCRLHYNERLTMRRSYRRRLGLCFDCMAPALRGRTRCAYHLIEDKTYKVKYTAKQAKARGWRMAKVPA